MKCSVFIATSLDGFIASEDGGIDWLNEAGDASADMQDNQDMGFAAFMQQIDCMVMGRHTMEKIASFNLSEEQWPYGDIPIFVLSRTLTRLPENLPCSVQLFDGEISDLVGHCEQQNLQHAYIDGGTVISEFINHGLIQQMIVTRAPVVLLKGIPLFKNLKRNVSFNQVTSEAFANNFIQETYQLSYPD